MPSTIGALPSLPGLPFVNTTSLGVDKAAASSRLVMTFDVPVAQSALGTAPYDLYFMVDHGIWYDVHMPGWPGFEGRAPWLPEETGASAFLDDEQNPWVIQVPYDWRFPMEQVPIFTAYPDFLGWVGSAGSQKKDWYDRVATGATSLIAAPPQVYLAPYAWTVARPIP